MANLGTQLKPNQVVGALAYAPHEPVMDGCMVASTQSAPLQNGQAVKLVASTGGIPTVVAATTGDAIYGIIPFDPIKNSYKAGEMVSIAKGDTYYFIANAAIAAGAKVAPVFATVGKVETSETSALGVAITSAAADEFVQILIGG